MVKDNMAFKFIFKKMLHKITSGADILFWRSNVTWWMIVDYVYTIVIYSFQILF